MTHNMKNIIDMIRQNDSCTIMEEIDRDKIALDIIKQTPSSFRFAGDKFKNNIELVTHVVKQNCKMYEFIGDKLKNNKELALYVLKNDMNMIKFIGNELKQDEEFINHIINSIKDNNILDNNMVNEFNKDVRTEDLEYRPTYKYTKIFFMGQTKGECMAFSFGIILGSILSYYVSKKK